MAIEVGEGITITGTFKDTNGDVTSPTEPVTVVVRNRLGEDTEAAATNTDVGVYEIEYTPTEAGIHYYTFYSADSPPAIQQDIFIANQVIAQKS